MWQVPEKTCSKLGSEEKPPSYKGHRHIQNRKSSQARQSRLLNWAWVASAHGPANISGATETFFSHCNTNLFSRFRNYVNLQDIWCNWPNVSKKLFNDKYLAWSTLCQSNGCMESLQIFEGRKKKNGLLVWISIFFFKLYLSNIHSLKPRTWRKVHILCNWCLAAYNSATQKQQRHLYFQVQFLAAFFWGFMG